MLDLFLNNRGRITSRQFIHGGYILILAAVALGLLEKASMGSALTAPIAMLTFIGSIILIVSWVCIWIKRLHHGGQKGWLILLYIFAYGFVLTILSAVIIMLFSDGSLLDLLLQHASGNIDTDEYYKAIEAMMPEFLLPIIVARAITSLAVLHFGDKIIPIDTNDNVYGPEQN